VIVYLLSIRHRNKISLRVGWKICNLSRRKLFFQIFSVEPVELVGFSSLWPLPDRKLLPSSLRSIVTSYHIQCRLVFEILSYDLPYRMYDITVPFIFISVRKSCRIDQSRRMRWAGHVARMGERRDVCWVLVGKPRGKETT